MKRNKPPKHRATSLARENPRVSSVRISRGKLLLLLGSLVFCLAASELTLRLFFAKTFPPTDDERSLLYEYDETLGWFPAKSTSRRFTASRTVTVTHNSRGFRDPEPELNGNPGIMFLGDSFVWGFDVEAEERFTDKLQQRHPDWNICNLGVSGYGTDQQFLLLQAQFEHYKPRVVFVVFCTDNDTDDNSYNLRSGGYYKPFFTIAGPTSLTLNGVPVPRSERAILAKHTFLGRFYLTRLLVRAYSKRRAPPGVQVVTNPTGPILLAMRSYVVRRGGFFAVAMQEGNEDLKNYLRRFQIPWLALRTTNRYESFGGHWTPDGHTEVCDQIEGFLAKGFSEGYIKLDTDPAEAKTTIEPRPTSP